jgi:hypothetical protein
VVVASLATALTSRATSPTGMPPVITTRFTFTERPGGGFQVSRAEYIPTVWNNYQTGPIRIVLVKSAADAGKADARQRQGRDAIRAAVTSLGPLPDLVES